MVTIDWYIISAIRYAVVKHGQQTRGPGHNLPYADHVLEVMQRLVAEGIQDPHVLTAAVLHDVVEDCGVGILDIEREFGSRVSRLVDWLTLPPEEHKDPARKLRYQKRMMFEMDDDARAIKIADKTSNVFALVSHPPAWKESSIKAYADSSREVVETAREATKSSVVLRLAATFGLAYTGAYNHYHW